MKIFDLALSAVIVFGATVFFAYIGYIYFDFGLFVTLPANIVEGFIQNSALQYVALGLGIVAMIAKRPVGRAIKQQEAENRS
ncbi:hypothetical protein [Pseudarthrobacter sp. PS3-L1]|uniref:hypothetical protein n=1 Tax=Pseudarthrobacter sp. PS3-L1 TaxID=3046207 RepID=UPI0024BA1B8D|nr:hypothetical protein [Pseudarthrobacter sp. PS3-L1]MDJ0318971.1 hypothetical protein [Pseudarthrobacter sp. PS3-L1]